MIGSNPLPPSYNSLIPGCTFTSVDVETWVKCLNEALYYNWKYPTNAAFSLVCNRSTPLIHWGRLMHICISKVTIIGSDNVLGAWSAPSHYLNQCWDIFHWTHENKFQWNFNQNSYIFIQENPFENIVCKMAAILSRPQCVKAPFLKSLWLALLMGRIVSNRVPSSL